MKPEDRVELVNKILKNDNRKLLQTAVEEAGFEITYPLLAELTEENCIECLKYCFNVKSKISPAKIIDILIGIASKKRDFLLYHYLVHIKKTS